MKKMPKEKKDRRPVTLDSRRRYEADIGCVAARQRAIEIAIVIDDDLHELGLPRYSRNNASLNDDWRPPLYWVSKQHPDGRGRDLMYECRHFFEGDCEQLPLSFKSIDDLLINANEVY